MHIPAAIQDLSRCQPDELLQRSGAVFVQIETDDGVTGLGGPITPSVAYIIDTELRWLLEGADPIASERLSDLMYRPA